MNLDNFVGRPKRRLVEKYARADAWAALTEEALAEPAREVAGLDELVAVLQRVRAAAQAA